MTLKTDCSNGIWKRCTNCGGYGGFDTPKQLCPVCKGHGSEKPIKCVSVSVVSKSQPRLGIDDSYRAMTKTTNGENSSEYKTPQKDSEKV